MIQDALMNSAWKIAEHVKDAFDSRKLKRLVDRGMKVGENLYLSNTALS